MYILQGVASGVWDPYAEEGNHLFCHRFLHRDGAQNLRAKPQCDINTTQRGKELDTLCYRTHQPVRCCVCLVFIYVCVENTCVCKHFRTQIGRSTVLNYLLVYLLLLAFLNASQCKHQPRSNQRGAAYRKIVPYY